MAADARRVVETSRFPHFLENRLTDGGEVVGLNLRPPVTPRKIPGTHFCWRLSRPQGHSVAGRIRSIEKCNELIGSRTRSLPIYVEGVRKSMKTHSQDSRCPVRNSNPEPPEHMSTHGMTYMRTYFRENTLQSC
jgi:hypothetical protein